MTDRQITHGPGCWGWGPKHYECAVAEIERLREQLRLATVDQAIAEAEANDARAEVEALLAERDALRKALGRILENEASDWKAAEAFGGYVLDDELREEARAVLSKENKETRSEQYRVPARRE